LVTPLFTVEVVGDDDEVRVVLRGDVDLAVVSELRRALEDALEVAARRVIVDLHEVTHLDSSGIKVFVRANIRARVTGKDFSLRGARGAVRRVLDITGVDRVVTLENEIVNDLAQELAKGLATDLAEEAEPGGASATTI